MESLEKQLICPICLEIFSKPVVILPCQHNLCRKCANDIFQASNPYLSSRSGSVASGGRFRCPSCRHEVVLDRHGVYGLQRNLLVENIIDMYKQGSTSSKVAPEPSRVEPMCEEHQEEKINIYCVTCGVPTCSLCKVFGTHQSCQVAPLDTVFQQHKAELTDCITMLVGNNERLQAIISNLEETCHTVEENGRRQKSRLCETFDQLFGLLEEKKTDMTVQINSEQEEKLDYIRGLKRRYTEHLENMAKVLETGINTMDESEMAVFLQTAKPLLQKLIEGTNTSHLEKVEQGYENMDHFTANFERQGRALLTVDFIKIEEEEEEEELHVTTSQPSPTATQPSPSAVQLPLPPTQQSASSFQQTPFTSQLVPPTSQLSSSTTQPTPPASQVAAGTSQLASTATQLPSTSTQLASTSTQLASTATQLASTSTQLAPNATKLVSTITQPDAAKGQLTPTASQLAPSTKSAGPGSTSQTQNQALQAGGSSAQSETGQTDNLEDKDGPRHVFSFSWLNQK